jgi:5-methylcytosine-specific restriction endonuclease McrA
MRSTVADQRFSIIPADAVDNDERWKLDLLASKPDMAPRQVDDCSIGDGSALAALMETSGGHCWYCGVLLTYGGAGVGSSITRDHLVPRARGGSNRPDNIVAACRSCNVSKQAKSVEDFRAYRGGVVFHGERAR